MKLTVREGGKTRLKLWLPNFILKTKLIPKLILSETTSTCEQIDNLQKLLASVHKHLKTYVKANGHFTLLETYSKDGDTVVIDV